MARLPKRDLLATVERAVLDSGWSYLHLSAPTDHPARYSVFRGDQSFAVRVYIWNLTPGGKNRPLDEWRIQATGVDQFRLEEDGKTLILGWEDQRGVFAGFDPHRHSGPLGHSPSLQLRERALDDAVRNGLAVHNKGNDELAVAFRPDFLATYMANVEPLHECGEFESEIDLLQQIGEVANVDDTDVRGVVAEPRRYAVVAARRALREIGFRNRVLGAYGHRCAMCGIQLRLLDAAHILPAAHPESTDGTDNGIALCALHHRAYDRTLVTFDAEFRTHANDAVIERLTAENRDGGLAAFRRDLRPILGLPPDRRDRPAQRFVNKANELRGWAT